jgi:hypothetical protein
MHFRLPYLVFPISSSCMYPHFAVCHGYDPPFNVQVFFLKKSRAVKQVQASNFESILLHASNAPRRPCPDSPTSH